MPYYFSQDGKEAIKIAGYYYVQPFGFSSTSLLERNPQSARLAVTVALTGFAGNANGENSYPSVTDGLAKTGKITIADIVGDKSNPILTASGFDTAVVSSSQSGDLALTTWIFHGGIGSSVTFTPANVQQDPNPGRVGQDQRIRWYGHADAGDGASSSRLNLSYIASQIGHWARHDLHAIDLMGIANMRQSGSLVAWLLGQNPNQELGEIKVTDESRGSRENKIAGTGGDGVQQVAQAFGTAYVFNGIFQNLPAATVAAFSRRFDNVAADIIRDAAREGTGIFADMTQRVLATPESTAKNPNSYDIVKPDFEGLSFWDLKPRGTTNAALLY